MPKYNAPVYKTGTFDLHNEHCSADSNFAEQALAEQLDISGAKVNLFKLLGNKETGKFVDLAQNGSVITSPTRAGYFPVNAFIDNGLVWRSDSYNNAFLGYNFGIEQHDSGVNTNETPVQIYQHITTIRIKQSPTSIFRALEVQVQNSNDGGLTWEVIDTLELPNDDGFHTFSVQESFPAQMWRLVPTVHNGVDTDGWEVENVEMMDYNATHISNIQDPIFMENRSRDYSTQSITLRAQYDLVDVQTEFSRFGIDIPTQYTFLLSFAKMVEQLGRPVVIGDIIELPSEMQYDSELNGINKWLEVTDASWSSQGFTAGWKPVLFKIVAEPLIASTEINSFMKDKIVDSFDDQDFFNGTMVLDNTSKVFKENLEVESDKLQQEKGLDTSDTPAYIDVNNDGDFDEGVDKEIYNSNAVYVEDGMPSNGEPYTEADELPTAPSDGDYHRLTYAAHDIPTKLFRWNDAKHRWIFMESDLRTATTSHRRRVADILNSPTQVSTK